VSCSALQGSSSCRSVSADELGFVPQVRNRVVYDSLDAPPDRKLSAQAASGDPTAAAAIVGPPAPSDSMSSKYVDGTLPPPFYTRDSPLDDTLVFESRFESGNLRRAIQVPSTKRAPCHALHGIAIPTHREAVH
jgi:hypothetical protein